MEPDIPKEQPKLIKRWIAEYRTKTKLRTVEMASVFFLNIDDIMELYS